MAKETAHKKEKFVNGINVDQLFGTIGMVKENPEIARFRFRATNRWIAGTHNKATVTDFYGTLEEHSSPEPRGFEVDEQAAMHFVYGYALDCIGRLAEGGQEPPDGGPEMRRQAGRKRVTACAARVGRPPRSRAPRTFGRRRPSGPVRNPV